MCRSFAVNIARLPALTNSFALRKHKQVDWNSCSWLAVTAAHFTNVEDTSEGL